MSLVAKRSEITATLSAPESTTDLARAKVIPPIATRGLFTLCLMALSAFSPNTGSGFVFVEVSKIGPIAM